MVPRPRYTSIENTSMQTMRLMRYTAQFNTRRLDAPITAKERIKYKTKTEEILLYSAVLNIAITNIAEELEQAGLFRHNIKRDINEVEKIILSSYESLYSRFQKVEKAITRTSYDNAMIQLSDAIDESILIPPPHRAYSIAIALCRMICKHNSSLGRFIIAEAYPIRQVIKKLERITVVKDYQIDFIIDRTLQSLRK